MRLQQAIDTYGEQHMSTEQADIVNCAIEWRRSKWTGGHIEQEKLLAALLQAVDRLERAL